MKKNLIYFSIFFFLLFFLAVNTKPALKMAESTKALPQVFFINQVRGEECCSKGIFENLKIQVEVFIKNKIPAFFAVRYDALTNKKYVDYLKQSIINNPTIIYPALMIEITPNLAKDAGIKYKDKENDWFEAQNAFTIGYLPEERKKLVDFLFKKFFMNFGYYPNLTSAWMIDTNTLNYINEKYGVKVHQITREQKGTDSYTLFGGPPHYPYPASLKWLFIPDYQRKNAPLIVRQTVADPFHNFEDKTNAFTSQSNDYANDGKTFDYFIDLVYQALFNQPEKQTGFALLGLENSMDLKFQEEYLKQIDYIASLKKDDRIIFPDINLLKTFWLDKKITVYYGKDLVNNVDKFVYWITTEKFRLRLFIDNRQPFVSDLRVYEKNLIDPYFKKPAKREGRWFIPKKEYTNIYGKISLPTIDDRNSLIINFDDQQKFIFKYKDEKGKAIIFEDKFGKMTNMLIWAYSLLSVIIVSLLSLLGIFTLGINEKKLQKIIIYFVSFSAGALLGDVFIHLIPEVFKNETTIYTSVYFLLGILVSFLIEKIIYWRENHSSSILGNKIKHFVSIILFGDGVHNFIDGLAIGASFLISVPVGIATSLAVILHEIPHEIGDFAALIHGGLSRKQALFYNFVSGLTAILGTLFALVLSQYIAGVNNFLIPFAAANLIYIAGTNLIPELHKETQLIKSLIQIFTFILGIAIMYGLLLVG
ncbi:MAG: ZIP family metal transporter [Patescibacteria group bacterium]